MHSVTPPQIFLILSVKFTCVIIDEESVRKNSQKHVSAMYVIRHGSVLDCYRCLYFSFGES